MTSITPKTNLKFIGHEAAEAQLLQDLSSDKLAHGWIVSGPRGIGKATLAYRFARTLLSGDSSAAIHNDHPVYLRMAAGSHADMLVIEPLFDAKKDEFAKDITVDQARKISEFLSLTAGEGQWRVVIVDAVDDLNTNGANAILKILEEPPPNVVLLLISHNPGRLLPTIRSRCRQLKLKVLSKPQFHQVVGLITPELSKEEADTLGELTSYSPGIALQLNEQGAIAFYTKMVELLLPLPALESLKIQSFAESLASGHIHANWRLFTRLALCLFERTVLQASAFSLTPISEHEAALFEKMRNLHPPHVWAAKWQEIADQFLLAERLHLDYKQFIIIFFHSIASGEAFKIGNAAA